MKVSRPFLVVLLAFAVASFVEAQFMEREENPPPIRSRPLPNQELAEPSERPVENDPREVQDEERRRPEESGRAGGRSSMEPRQKSEGRKRSKARYGYKQKMSKGRYGYKQD